ncbi:MAG TPA: hypothetical protein VN577_03205 [Terriglobales bacterium]|nr:hypothetical protein [Terriglobales bacterium]
MNRQRTISFAIALAFSTLPLFSQAPVSSQKPVGQMEVKTEKKKAPLVIPDKKITDEGKMELIRGLNAELGYARKPFPFGKKGIKLDAKTGETTPTEQEVMTMIGGFGPNIRVGDRTRITEVKFKGKSILLDLNGGAEKKKKWFEHIQVGGAGGVYQPGQPTDDTNLRGSTVEIVFDKFIPAVTPEQVKQILDPLLNFSAKSATEAYLDTIPPIAKEAIRDHKVLVGMNREMVVYAKGRPPQKTRERDGETEYEEWIYGTPPQDVEFVRFVGDEVTQVKLMKVDGTKVVRTDREVNLETDKPEVASGQTPGAATPPAQTASNPADQGPQGKPSLKRPGEDVNQPTPAIPPPPGSRGPVGGPDPNPNPNDAPK